MEYNINNNLNGIIYKSDITYKSELILDIFKYSGTNKMSRINSPKQLTVISFRKLWAH